MIRNKVVWDKHYYSNRFTVRNIFLLRYSRFRLMCTFNEFAVHVHAMCTFKSMPFLGDYSSFKKLKLFLSL